MNCEGAYKNLSLSSMPLLLEDDPGGHLTLDAYGMTAFHASGHHIRHEVKTI
ncbi:MAG: hypothetical protein ACP5K1_00405 [Candidatus Bathyarchaeia archaeon]